MSDSILRQQVVEYVRNLPDEDLSRLFYEALSSRSEQRSHGGGGFTNTGYVIGTAVHSDAGPAEIEILACAFDRHEPILDEVKHRGALQQGQCEVCRTMLASTSKIAECPVCGARTECT